MHKDYDDDYDDEDEGVHHTYLVRTQTWVEATSPRKAGELALISWRLEFEESEGPDQIEVRQFVDTDKPYKVYKVYPNEEYSVQRKYE